MDDLRIKFDKVAIRYNNMIFFKPIDAIEIVEECYKQGKRVYGIDAFILKELSIQPFMEHSINENENLDKKQQTISFVNHLKKYLDRDFVFEVVYEGY